MLRFGVLLAASSLALTGCGDLVKFPGSGDEPGVLEPSAPPPPPPTEPVNQPETNTSETTTPVETTPVVEPVPEPEPEVTEPEVTEVVEPVEPEAPEVVDTPTEEVVVELPEESEVVEIVDPAPTITPTPVPNVASLLEINAQICAASDNPTMTVAEVAGAGAPQTSQTFGTAVVNGTEVDRSLFPGIVKLEPRRRIPGTTRTTSGHCSATRISEQWFVTAAHCLDSAYDSVTIVAGVNRLSDPTARRLTAQTTICHSSYGGAEEEFANDVALVKMSPDSIAQMTDIPIANYGATLKTLSSTNYPTVDMAGWGLTSFAEHLSNELLTARLDTNKVGPAIISIASKDGSGPCVGDSGGPLFVTEANGQKTLVGVLSVVENNLQTGEFCSGQYNGRYTNLQGFVPWVQQVIGVCDSSQGDSLCIDR